MSVNTYTFEQLEVKTLAELEEIKQEKQNDLYELRREKYLLINNILSLQGMFRSERDRLIQDTAKKDAG